MAEEGQQALAALRKQFELFHNSEVERFRVNLRRTRAGQVRQLLADPETVDLALFNREVWLGVREVRLDGQKLSEDLFDENLTPVHAIELDKALAEGRLVVQGNSVWGSGARLYGIALRIDDDAKLKLVRQAVAVLNDRSLPPLRKAQQVENISGFGRNSASGLAMLFHAQDVAIYNKASESAMGKLGLPCGTMDEFQASASKLRQGLGAKDFLELDWFLYLISQGRITLANDRAANRHYWWVNHGKLFEVESAAGVLASPAMSVGGKSLQHWENVLKVQQNDAIFHYAGGQVVAVGFAQQAGHQSDHLPYERHEAGPYNVVSLRYEALKQPVAKDSIPLKARLAEQAGPFNRNGDLKQAFLFPLSESFVNTLLGLSGELRNMLENNMPPKDESVPTIAPLNQILYGPPGTGKTYISMQKAVEICDGKAPKDRKVLMDRYRQLQQDKRIALVTFHQSYGYEEFVEGIRPVLGGDAAAGLGDADGEDRVYYECRPGVFKTMCMSAKAAVSPLHPVELKEQGTRFWKMSLGNTSDPSQAHVYEECIQNGYILLGYGYGLDFAGCDDRDAVKERLRSEVQAIKNTDYNVTSVNTFKNEMKQGDIVIVSDGLHLFRAIGRVTGDYRLLRATEYGQMRPVEWLLVLEESLPREKIMNKSLSQMTLYELQTGVLRLDSLRDLLSGRDTNPKNHVLIIDEINRGNISKILGELITLLEVDKRLGQENELKTVLPYSGEEFGVPSNLYIIGTMNTADRSIAFMDVALRRRFEFHEMMPNIQLVRQMVGVVGGVDVSALLDSINLRIESLYDRDHQIGHACFLGVKTLADLRNVFLNRVIPLLQEYFYDDWSKLCAVLGCPYDMETGNLLAGVSQPLIKTYRLPACLDHEDTRLRYSIADGFLHAEDDDLQRFFAPVAKSGLPASPAEDQ